MGTVSIFFDTYAFFEILRNNPSYKRFWGSFSVVTTRLNLMELYYGLLKNYDAKTAGHVYNYLLHAAVDIDDAAIKEAMQFRFQNRKRKLSYADCIGYIVAMRNNIKFLTGDKQFKNFPNVEFVV